MKERRIGSGRVVGRALLRGATLVVLATSIGACKKQQPAAGETASASAALPPVAPGTQRVLATEEGFKPSRVDLKQGTTLVFRRTSDATCATSVVFPDMKIEKELPLNTDVSVALPASARGEVGFQCGMGMYKSKIVVID